MFVEIFALVPCGYLCPVGTCALWVLVPCGYHSKNVRKWDFNSAIYNGFGQCKNPSLRHALHAGNPCGFSYFTGFLLSRLCKKPSIGRVTCGKPLRVWLFYWVPAFETVQKTSLGYAGGKPNPLNPPYQGDFPLNSPLIRGARGVKNDER